jgi:hypothetical protein
MQSKVFGPLGITRMILGSTEFEYRLNPEARYFTHDSALVANVRRAGPPANAMWPYGGWNLENMDAHGGWLASAVDLACFATALDSTGLHPILNQSSINATFAVPSIGAAAGSPWYGCGWYVRSAGPSLNTWHNGSLDGTWTLMVRRFDGLNWVALFNQRDDPSGLSYDAIDDALHAAANAVTTWPDVDLFPGYGLPNRSHAFTDEALTAGVVVKSVHVSELRTRIEWARARRGLAPFGYAEAIAPGTGIKASHVIELRSALAAVYAALTLSPPAYTDPVLTTGMVIKAAHIAELRAGVRAID